MVAAAANPLGTRGRGADNADQLGPCAPPMMRPDPWVSRAPVADQLGVMCRRYVGFAPDRRWPGRLEGCLLEGAPREGRGSSMVTGGSKGEKKIASATNTSEENGSACLVGAGAGSRAQAAPLRCSSRHRTLGPAHRVSYRRFGPQGHPCGRIAPVTVPRVVHGVPSAPAGGTFWAAGSEPPGLRAVENPSGPPWKQLCVVARVAAAAEVYRAFNLKN